MFDALYGLWVLLSGRHLDGQQRTDATWFRRATDGVNGYNPSPWSRLPRAHRAGARLVAMFAATALVMGVLQDRVAAGSAAVGLFWIALFYFGYAFYRWCRKYGHYTDRYVLMHRRLFQSVGWSRHKHPRDWLVIPVDYAQNPDVATVLTLPDEFKETKALKTRIESNVANVLGLHAPDFTWSVGIRPATLTCRLRPAPPPLVDYKALLPRLSDRSPGQVILGVRPGDLSLVINLRGENPHIALSVSTGGGKSRTASVIAMQVLHDGGIALVCDVKIVSVPWARNLDQVRYCTKIADIHSALCWLKTEIDRRFDVMGDTADEDGNVDIEAVGPPLLLVLEEANTLIPDLVQHWRDIKEPSDPPTSPAIMAIRRALAMGRGGRVHVLGIAQYLTAAAIGGPAARENFATRILMKPTHRVWNLLAGPEHKVGGRWPVSTNEPGRAHVLNNGVVEECQIALVEPREAKDYATSGVRTRFPALVPGTVPVESPGAEVIQLRRDTGTAAPEAPAQPEPVGLRQACEEGLVHMSYEAARKARLRARGDEDASFPVPKAWRGNQELYDPTELAAFFDSCAVEA